jgi:hypothetical protein
MAEVLVRFDAVLTAPDGRQFTPQACGRPAGNVWEGWIEFAPVAGGPPVRTPRETEQPNRNDLLYWAQGLTRVYLDGALSRALHEPLVVERALPIESHFDGPAPAANRAPVSGVVARPVLDPFSVVLQGEEILARELGALDTSLVRDIAVAYGFVGAEEAAAATREQLTGRILAAARRPNGPGLNEDLRAGA